MSQDQQPGSDAKAPPPVRRGPKPHHYAAAVMSAVAFLVLGVMAVVRFGVLTDTGRALVVRKLDGLDLGTLGKLRVAGLDGDLWSAFSLQRLAIVDGRGPWLEVNNLRVDWEPLELLNHRVHADLLLADKVTLAHRPTLSGGGPSGGQRLTIRIDHLQTGLETAPAVSVERGLFQLAGAFDLEQDGGVAGAVQASNLLHVGDGLNATFDLGVGKKVLLDAHAHESRGGAIAGILGLATGKPFNLDVKAGGDVDVGQVKLLGSVGDQTIAAADGAWTRKGGVARGWASLTASRWTANYQAAFGRRVDFVMQQSQVKDAVKQIDARLFADRASLSASGALDTAKLRSDDGLKLQLQIADLSKLIAAPAVGPARFVGVVKGAPGDWDLQGQTGLERLSLQGYSLARAGGTVHLLNHKGELKLTATADGAGGSGGGLAGALAGARPHVSLDGSRLPDGRLLLHDLKAEGDGLKVAATGGKGLLGDLTFKGQAQLASLAAVRPGAKGAMVLRWSASQLNARQPWKFGLEAAGSGVATGQEQLDHLLGDKPKFTTQASYADGAVTVAQLDLTGAGARASGSGALTKGGGLKFVFDWSAVGPFGAGPVEIDGKASGSALIGGTLADPRADLGADFERIDLPQLTLTAARATLNLAKGANGLTGAVSLSATDATGPAHAKAAFAVVVGSLNLEQVDAAAGGASAQGSIGLKGSQVSSADLTLAAGPGAFLAQGRADARLRVTNANVDLNLSASNAVLKGQGAFIKTLAVRAHGPWSQLAYTAVAEVQSDQTPFKLNGGGGVNGSDKGLAMSFNGSGVFRHAGFKTLSPALVTLNGTSRAARLELALGGGRADIQADQNGPALTAKAALAGVDLGALGEDLAGRIDANLSLTGEGERLDGKLEAQLKGARSRDAPAKLAMNGSIDATLSGPRLAVDAEVDGSGPADKAEIHAVLPTQAAASPFRFAVDQTRPIEGRFAVNGELQPVWDLFFGDGRELGGQLVAKGALGGTLKSPQISGHGALSQGRFEDAGTGLKLRGLSAEADLQGETLDLQRFAASDGRSGTLSGQGRVDLAPNGASTLTLTAHSFQLLDNETAKATASGTITVAQNAQGRAKLSGALTVDRADISAETSRSPPGVVTMEVVERNRPFSMSQGLQAQPRTGPSIDIDVSISAPRRIYVRGLGLDAELSLDAHVVGTTSDPQLQGTARIVRGDYDFAGNRFTIDDRGVVYLASSPDKIRLDLTATRDNPTLTAIIRIQGTAAKPQITLTSTPVLPDDEVLSQVLFGTSAAQLSPVQAAQLAAAVTTLATGGGFDVMGGLKNFARLDRLALGGDSGAGVSVSGGKYIGSRVYLEVSGGGRQGPSAQVEVKATKSLSMISQVGGESGAKLQVRWRHDYGRPPAAAK